MSIFHAVGMALSIIVLCADCDGRTELECAHEGCFSSAGCTAVF